MKKTGINISKIVLLISLFLGVIPSYINANTSGDSIFTYCDYVLKNKHLYEEQKQMKINNLKSLLRNKDLPQEQQYAIRLNLCDEYKKYELDSAIHYIRINITGAEKLTKKDWLAESNMLLSLYYSTVGSYVESVRIMEKIRKDQLPSHLIPLYYEVYSEYYSHYAQSNNYHEYYALNENYRDSLLMVLEPNSIKYRINNIQKKFFGGAVDEAENLLLELIPQTTDEQPERAIIAYLLGLVYKQKGNTDLQKKYYSISTITDIKNANKDNASQQSLALVYYEEGNIDMAFKFMQSAIDDANFCNVRFRTIESSQFFTAINNSYLAKERKQKDELKYLLTLISVLSIFLIIAVVNTYRQMKRLSRIRKELYHTNEKLKDLNDSLTDNVGKLQDTNIQLSESNRVKEEYIAHFFDVCSSYIGKMENYRKQLYKKVTNNKMNELVKDLKSTVWVDAELEELYRNFDTIFLNLYPTFIEEFNRLLIKEEQVYPKQGELLNTELRIFALIRLGITDSTKIAAFLRYSLSTIYNYRTKARNKAAVTRDQFEVRVMKIGIFHKEKQ